LNADACLAFAVQKNGAGGCLIGQKAAVTREDCIGKPSPSIRFLLNPVIFEAIR
jgi:hypothetical protein